MPEDLYHKQQMNYIDPSLYQDQSIHLQDSTHDCGTELPISIESQIKDVHELIVVESKKKLQLKQAKYIPLFA